MLHTLQVSEGAAVKGAARTSTGVTVGCLALTVKCEYVEIHRRLLSGQREGNRGCSPVNEGNARL